MSLTSGGTALNPLSSGGRSLGVRRLGRDLDHLLRLPVAPCRCVASSRYHIQIDAERSSSEITTPTKP